MKPKAKKKRVFLHVNEAILTFWRNNIWIWFNLPLPAFDSRTCRVAANSDSDEFGSIEWFSNECRKTKTKAITPTNHNRNRQRDEPITIPNNYL